jgi:hypothetical protein
MITFLLYTLLALVANACVAKIIFFSIQDGQWLDKLFNWQYRLRKWAEGNKWWVKPLGYCEMCFAHLMAVLGFVLYSVFMSAAHLWVLHHWLLGVIWYLVYVGIATNLSLYFIVKLFK